MLVIVYLLSDVVQIQNLSTGTGCIKFIVLRYRNGTFYKFLL